MKGIVNVIILGKGKIPGRKDFKSNHPDLQTIVVLQSGTGEVEIWDWDEEERLLRAKWFNEYKKPLADCAMDLLGLSTEMSLDWLREVLGKDYWPGKKDTDFVWRENKPEKKIDDIILRSSIYCKYCGKDVDFIVVGDDTCYKEDKERYEKDAKEAMDHCHWIDYHQRCAVCGEILRGEDLELMKKPDGIQMHAKFVAETLDREPDTTYLIVHRECSSNSDA